MRVDHRTRPRMLVLSLLATVLPYLPPGGAVAADFDSIEFEAASRRRGKVKILAIQADGTCTYQGGGQRLRPHDPNPLPAKVYKHTLSAARMDRLSHLLAETKWLQAPAKARGLSFHAGKLTITLRVGGEDRQVDCAGDQDEPYDGLLWFYAELGAQERMLHDIQWGDREARLRACESLGGPIAGLRGEPNKGLPFFELDYGRYVGELRKILAEPEKHRDGMGYQLTAAIDVLSYVGDEESFERIGQLTLDRNRGVRKAAINALAYLRRPELIPFLAEEMVDGSAAMYAAWALIQLGDMAVPVVAKTVAANDSRLAYKLIRAYIDHWDELAAPVDRRVLAAVRVGMPKQMGAYAEYYGYVLDLARLRPITTAPMLGRLHGRNVLRREESTLLHGWYICQDGKIVRHGPAPKTDTSVRHLDLTAFDPQVAENTLRFSAGWQAKPGIRGRRPAAAVKAHEVPVPENSVLEVDCTYRRGTAVPGGGAIGHALRLTPQYRIFWQGRVVSNGKHVLTLTYIGRLARPTDPEQSFAPPDKPLPYRAPPKRNRWPLGLK